MWLGECLTSHHQVQGVGDSRPFSQSTHGVALAAVAATVTFLHVGEVVVTLFP